MAFSTRPQRGPQGGAHLLGQPLRARPPGAPVGQGLAHRVHHLRARVAVQEARDLGVAQGGVHRRQRPARVAHPVGTTQAV